MILNTRTIDLHAPKLAIKIKWLKEGGMHRLSNRTAIKCNNHPPPMPMPFQFIPIASPFHTMSILNVILPLSSLLFKCFSFSHNNSPFVLTTTKHCCEGIEKALKGEEANCEVVEEGKRAVEGVEEGICSGWKICIIPRFSHIQFGGKMRKA